MILGIDLGQITTGLAISEGELASPYSTITHKSLTEAVSKIVAICDQNSIDKIVVGFVEGKDKNYFEKFANLLKHQLAKIEVVLWDETLSTRQARQTMIKLNVPKEKRGEKEHEVAASLILQSYLDSEK